MKKALKEIDEKAEILKERIDMRDFIEFKNLLLSVAFRFTSLYSLTKLLLKSIIVPIFEKVFNTSYDDSMKTFFERHYSFDIKQKTVEDIFKMVSNKTTIIPFSVTVRI